MRLAALIESRGGRWEVFTSTSRFVTGLGLSHPVENGFAWHPALGTPYLPGSSVKGMVRAWAKLDAHPKPDCGLIERLLGAPDKVGSVCILDAVPIEPVQLVADVMTPHYAGWTEDDPPGDWRSPTPVPFLVTAAETPFLFGIVPRRAVSGTDLDAVIGWLRSAVSWAGGGAKTAVGYGRFRGDTGKTDDLRKRLPVCLALVVHGPPRRMYATNLAQCHRSALCRVGTGSLQRPDLGSGGPPTALSCHTALPPAPGPPHAASLPLSTPLRPLIENC